MAEFLRLVGAALAELPADRVEVERRVLRAEAQREDPGVVARMLDHRFGAAGFGLTNYGELGLRWLDAEDLRRWSAERFTRGNAVLWMTGEPPDDLGLELPDGPRHPLPLPEPLELELPGYVAEGSGGVALTGLGERSTALRVAMAVAGERLYDAVRGERGLAYAPAGGYMELDRASATRSSAPTAATSTPTSSCARSRARSSTWPNAERRRRSSSATGARPSGRATTPTGCGAGSTTRRSAS